MAKLADLKGKLVLIRWVDILEMHGCDDVLDPADYEKKIPVFEIVGKIKHVRRGIVVVTVEWAQMADYEDYDGDAGKTTQLIPAGCIESIFELKVGKKAYQKPIPKDDDDAGREPSKPSSE